MTQLSVQTVGDLFSVLPQGCEQSVLCRLRHCPFFFPFWPDCGGLLCLFRCVLLMRRHGHEERYEDVFGQGAAKRESAHDLIDWRRIYVTTSLAQVALRVEKHPMEKFW